MMYKTRFLISLWAILLGLLVGQIVYYQTIAMDTSVQKKDFYSIMGLPDHAIVSETHATRHRSLATSFELFSESPLALDHFFSSFVYATSPAITHTPARIERAH